MRRQAIDLVVIDLRDIGKERCKQVLTPLPFLPSVKEMPSEVRERHLGSVSREGEEAMAVFEDFKRFVRIIWTVVCVWQDYRQTEISFCPLKIL
jgi:hypothetical protein